MLLGAGNPKHAFGFPRKPREIRQKTRGAKNPPSASGRQRFRRPSTTMRRTAFGSGYASGPQDPPLTGAPFKNSYWRRRRRRRRRSFIHRRRRRGCHIGEALGFFQFWRRIGLLHSRSSSAPLLSEMGRWLPGSTRKALSVRRASDVRAMSCPVEGSAEADHLVGGTATPSGTGPHLFSRFCEGMSPSTTARIMTLPASMNPSTTIAG